MKALPYNCRRSFRRMALMVKGPMGGVDIRLIIRCLIEWRIVRKAGAPFLCSCRINK